MNHKTSTNIPVYPCTRCPHKMDCDLLETPRRCQAWMQWNKALSTLGEKCIAEKTCPCNQCPNPVCVNEPDGKGSCFAYCAWKVGLDPESL